MNLLKHGFGAGEHLLQDIVDFVGLLANHIKKGCEMAVMDEESLATFDGVGRLEHKRQKRQN
jgi:hypothetical protein